MGWLTRFKNRRGQYILEYTTLIVIVIAATIVMYPYVVRSWNAYVKGLDNSAEDSITDPLLEAGVLDGEAPDCACSIQDPPLCKKDEETGVEVCCGCGGFKTKTGTRVHCNMPHCDLDGVPHNTSKCEFNLACCTDWEQVLVGDDLACGTDYDGTEFEECKSCDPEETCYSRTCGENTVEYTCRCDDNCIAACSGTLPGGENVKTMVCPKAQVIKNISCADAEAGDTDAINYIAAMKDFKGFQGKKAWRFVAYRLDDDGTTNCTDGAFCQGQCAKGFKPVLDPGNENLEDGEGWKCECIEGDFNKETKKCEIPCVTELPEDPEEESPPLCPEPELEPCDFEFVITTTGFKLVNRGSALLPFDHYRTIGSAVQIDYTPELQPVAYYGGYTVKCANTPIISENEARCDSISGTDRIVVNADECVGRPPYVWECEDVLGFKYKSDLTATDCSKHKPTVLEPDNCVPYNDGDDCRTLISCDDFLGGEITGLTEDEEKDACAYQNNLIGCITPGDGFSCDQASQCSDINLANLTYLSSSGDTEGLSMWGVRIRCEQTFSLYSDPSGCEWVGDTASGSCVGK